MDNDVQMELVPRSLLYHLLGMHLIVFVVFPYLSFLSITSTPATESRIQMYQTICALFMMGLGTLATFTFSNHNSVHSITGLITIWIVLPIWILSQHTNALKSCIVTADRLYSMNKWIFMVLLLIVLPTEWMLGVQYYPAFAWMHQERYIASERMLGVYSWIDFIGHYIPSYALTISGAYFIWNHQEMEHIMNWEMYSWMVPAVFSGFEFMNNSNGHKYILHHIMLDGIAVILGFVSFLIYKLKVFLILKNYMKFREYFL